VSSARDDWLRLGVLTAPWGTRGEVKVRPDVEPAYLERIAERIARVYLGPEHRAIDLLGKLPHDAYGYVLRTPSLTK